MTEAVLVFTFGPVQPFIAEARRASDLFVGSQVLAQLAEAVARALRRAGADLVYPAAPKDGADLLSSELPEPAGQPGTSHATRIALRGTSWLN